MSVRVDGKAPIGSIFGRDLHPNDMVAGSSEVGWPRVEASFEYHRPLRFEDEFEVHLRIVGKDARTIRYEGVIRKGDIHIATGRIAVKCVSKTPGEPMRSTDIPPEIDALFQIAPGS